MSKKETFQVPRDSADVTVTLNRREVRLTNLRKPFWPERHITKGDLIHAREWYARGFTQAMKTPDDTLVFVTPEEEKQMFAEAAQPADPTTRRDPEEVAKELLKDVLGARKLE